jgi:hypothetical protein
MGRETDYRYHHQEPRRYAWVFGPLSHLVVHSILNASKVAGVLVSVPGRRAYGSEETEETKEKEYVFQRVEGV